MAVVRNHAAARWDFDLAFQDAGLPAPFPRRISFGDIDAELCVGPGGELETEIGGHFMVIEGKRDGEQLSIGQKRTMAARARDGRFCIVVRGSPPCDVHSIEVWGGRERPASIADLHDLVRRWADWAGSEPLPPARLNWFALFESWA